MLSNYYQASCSHLAKKKKEKKIELQAVNS